MPNAPSGRGRATIVPAGCRLASPAASLRPPAWSGVRASGPKPGVAKALLHLGDPARSAPCARARAARAGRLASSCPTRGAVRRMKSAECAEHDHVDEDDRRGARGTRRDSTHATSGVSTYAMTSASTNGSSTACASTRTATASAPETREELRVPRRASRARPSSMIMPAPARARERPGGRGTRRRGAATTSSRYSGMTRTSASTGMKFVSPSQRGTT